MSHIPSPASTCVRFDEHFLVFVFLVAVHGCICVSVCFAFGVCVCVCVFGQTRQAPHPVYPECSYPIGQYIFHGVYACRNMHISLYVCVPACVCVPVCVCVSRVGCLCLRCEEGS